MYEVHILINGRSSVVQIPASSGGYARMFVAILYPDAHIIRTVRVS